MELPVGKKYKSFSIKLKGLFIPETFLHIDVFVPLGTHRNPLHFLGSHPKSIGVSWILPSSSVDFGWVLTYLTWIYKQRCKIMKYIYLNEQLLYKWTGLFIQVQSSSFCMCDSKQNCSPSCRGYTFPLGLKQNEKPTNTISWNISAGSGSWGIQYIENTPFLVDLLSGSWGIRPICPPRKWENQERRSNKLL